MTDKELETVTELAEYYKGTDFNNFFCHLPGGIYRNRSPDSPKSKLQEDLDREAVRLGIDTETIFAEMERGNGKIGRAITVMQKLGNTPEAKTLSDEGEAMRQSAHEKMIPLFDALVALGYHPNDLVS